MKLFSSFESRNDMRESISILLMATTCNGFVSVRTSIVFETFQWKTAIKHGMLREENCIVLS